MLKVSEFKMPPDTNDLEILEPLFREILLPLIITMGILTSLYLLILFLFKNKTNYYMYGTNGYLEVSKEPYSKNPIILINLENLDSLKDFELEFGEKIEERGN
jgi:hypothetical protein